MAKENSGYLVVTKNGKYGRTYHNKPLINGKTPVYLEIDFGTGDNRFITGYMPIATLCETDSLKILGFID